VADVGDVFRALADPTRRAILDELTDRDGQTLFELCTRLIVKHGLASTRQAVSQHLDVLEDAGLITVRRAGRYKFHDLDTRPIEQAVARWIDRTHSEDSR
jgi:DNA-binding transcriptional ArsR family regulator